jgi:hypothetical protein
MSFRTRESEAIQRSGFKKFATTAKKAREEPGQDAYRSGRMRQFGGMDKEMRSIFRAGKIWVEGSVGIERSGMT